MAHQKTRICKQLVCVMLVLLVCVAVNQTIQIAHAQTTASQWGMNLQIQKVGANSTSSVFSPFDQVQLNAAVTCNNASQPDMLVYFNVTGPIGAPNPTIISRVETTNASGETGFSFRFPIQSGNESFLVGNWQASATMQTSGGLIQQNLNFTTQWSMQIASINLLNAQCQNQTAYAPGDPVTVQLTINNPGQPESANITVNMQDQQGNIINQTQIINSQIDTSSTNSTSQVQTDIQIPDDTALGQVAIAAAIYIGNYQGVDIPVAESQTAYLTVASNSTTITTTPTATPTPGPTVTPPPNIVENTVTLFSWLLVATGLFTFTTLFMFLKRKPTLKIGTQMPNMPATKTSPTAAEPLDQSTINKPAQQPTTTSTAGITPEKVMQATTTMQIPNIYETWESQTTPTKSENSESQESSKSIGTQLAKIAGTGKRIQILQETLNIEKDQLAKEIKDLNKTIEAQEKEMKNYFDTIKQTIANIDPDLNRMQNPTEEDDEAKKPKKRQKSQFTFYIK